MSGLLIVTLIASVIAALLWVLKVRGAELTLAAATLAIGCAGYAIQGRPELQGSPSDAEARTIPVPLTAARQAMMGRFIAADTWSTIAESYAARGQTKDAVGVMRSAVRARPTDYAMWVGLGNTLSDHAQTLTPAARFAFARAAQLAPNHPAPRFFLGLALARSGQSEQALAMWRDVLAEAPADASWRAYVEDGVLMLSGPPRAANN